MKRIFINNVQANIERVYSQKAKKELCCEEKIFSYEDVISSPSLFKETEYIFSTWGMPKFTGEEIRACFPSLKCVFYAAGTVQYFARPFMENGVKVFSAWAANAVPVAEYTLAQILLANKGFFHGHNIKCREDYEKAGTITQNLHGNYDITVGIIGAGMIGRKVIELLKPFNIKTVVFDPFLTDKKAKELGTEKVSLKELFSSCEIVSNHLANNEETRGMLNFELFNSMKPYSAFINTGRGAQVVEEDLVRVLRERPDIYALLDVTYPEPPKDNHPFYTLRNCVLTPHIAGSLGREVHRMAEYMQKEYESFIKGKPCLYEVTAETLKTMA